MSYKLSIIVPCYNVEKYLYKTVDSILYQDFKEWELLLVDDGSKDNTSNIIDEYVAKDKRICAIHKSNGGVSSARNYGIKRSTGDYLLFIDGDDWFCNNAFNKYIDAIKKYNSDIYHVNNYINKGRIEKKRHSLDLITRTEIEKQWFVLDTLYPYIDQIKNGIFVGSIRGVNGKLYRRTLLVENNILFDERLKIAEDAFFNYHAYLAAKSITMLNEYLFHYCINSDSVMHKYNPSICKTNNQLMTVFFKEIELYLGKNENYRICFLGMAAECIFRAMKLNFLHPDNPKKYAERKEEFKEYLLSPILQKALEYKYLPYIQNGKKQILWCIKRNYIKGALKIGALAMKYLQLKNEM